MKQLLSVSALLVVLPGAAHAQIDVVFNGSRPVLRANVAGLNVSASVGDNGGLDLRVGDVPIGRASIPTTRRTSTGSSSTSSRTSRTTRSSRASASAAAIIATGDQYVGTKYVWGGETPRGFDCSGFVQYVFREHGVNLPRTSRQQAQVGIPVSRSLSALEVGDLLFFATSGSRINHVAIYAGNNQILHSSSSNGGVAYDDLSTKRGQWFVNHHVATRRVLSNGQNLVGPLTAALKAFAPFDPPDRAPKR